ncbi:MAG: cytochrome c biogenesis protein ResB [Sedimentibacter sp.]
MLKKFTNFLTSLKFGIVLFLIIAVYSIIGTVIPQGMDMKFYLEQYEVFGSLMIFLGFDHVYSSKIFLIIVFIFTVNLVGCTLKILPSQLRKMKDDYIPAKSKESENLYYEDINIEKFKEVLKKKKFKIIETENGEYAVKHKVGYIGSSITHLGIIIIILGGVISNIFAEEGYINLIRGERADFDEYGFSLVLDDFYMTLREDGSVEQYYSELSIYEENEKINEEKIWVNNPLSLNGIDFYQSYYGWASKLNIRDKDNVLLYESVIKDNFYDYYHPEDLTVLLYGFYPDFSMDKKGNPVSVSLEKNKPAYAVMLYKGEEYVSSHIVAPGQPIEYNGIKIEFVDSVLYTGITYRRDFGYYFVLLGCAVLTLGILLSFYFYPKYILLSSDSIIPVARQNVWGYTVKIKHILKELKNKSRRAV